MASGSSGRANHSGSKAFDFGSDDILCAYEDYGSQDGNNGIHTDAKEFNKSRVARSPVFTAASYSTPEESSYNEGVISTVENTMKKYTDNLMRFLEGISSRLSQLELYCYNLDKSIGEMRSDLSRDHGESESKLKSLEKHVQEVHRSVQILRDKQELADTHKELAKLQLEHKDSSSGGNNQQNEERISSAPSSDAKKGSENPSSGHDQQQPLALALPHQVAPHQPSMAPPQSMGAAYYLPQMNNNNMTSPSQTPQYLPAPSQAQTPHVNQQVVSPYQQQWQAQPPTHQPQVRTSSQMGGPFSYQNAEMAQKPSFVGAPQPGSEGMHYGYGAAGSRPIQQPQHLKPTSGATGYGPQPGEGYSPSGPRPALPPGNSNAYMAFDSEGGRTAHHHLPQFQQQNAYPPPSSSIPPQRMPPTNASPNINNMGVPPQSSMRPHHPYNELIDKLGSMGYRVDHVVAIIQRLEESGQPIDFNSVLDMLNGHSHSVGGGGSQRGGWSA